MKSLTFFKSTLATTLAIGSWRLVLLLAIAVSLIGYPNPASAATVNVAVGWYGGLIDFHPSSVMIHPGDQVKWIWLTSDHSTTSGSPGMPNGIWNSGVRSQGATFTRTFNRSGYLSVLLRSTFAGRPGNSDECDPNTKSSSRRDVKEHFHSRIRSDRRQRDDRRLHH